MHKLSLMIVLAAILPACAEEVIAVHDSSLAKKMGQLSRGGWEVTTNEQMAQRRATANDANTRVVRGMNWNNAQFDTNFQVDDPQLRAQLEQQRQQRLKDQQDQQNRQTPPSPQPASQPPAQPPATPGPPSLFGPVFPGL